jgi:glycosyltransferase involved in cell wall biosynthesis
MKADTKAPAWPQRMVEDRPSPLLVTSLDDLEQLNSPAQQTIVLTDGWKDGPLAAVLRGGSNAQAVLEVLHRAGVADLTIYHLEERLPQLESVFLSSVVSRANDLFENVNICWRHDPSVFDLVESIGQQYRMLFFGAPLAASEVAPFCRRLKEVYPGNVAIVRGPLSAVEFAESDEIYRWVRAHTFDASDFSLPSVLLSRKKKLQLRIAVVLPSLNEQQTVGEVIKAALEVRKIGLIDEVILIDSGSTDRTVEIARGYGIPVYLHREIRPDLGAFHGKGEAMFKSAFVTEADVLAWVDTDIASIAPRFFYGLFGPMLTDPDLRFVKGYFARPIRVEPGGLELGGGRVTEILARPWLNAFRPELSGYIQPLAGTVAIRRDLFRQMSIPVNFGVEIAMLIQAVEKAGLWSTCQVNLGEVIHRSKDVLALSEMSFQILQVLAHLDGGCPRPAQEILRRVFSAHGRFELGLKRFITCWRQFAEVT